MWDLLLELIVGILEIWWVDSNMRNSSLLSGSKFDREARRFTACLCIGAILLLLIVGVLVWWAD